MRLLSFECSSHWRRLLWRVCTTRSRSLSWSNGITRGEAMSSLSLGWLKNETRHTSTFVLCWGVSGWNLVRRSWKVGFITFSNYHEYFFRTTTYTRWWSDESTHSFVCAIGGGYNQFFFKDYNLYLWGLLNQSIANTNELPSVACMMETSTSRASTWWLSRSGCLSKSCGLFLFWAADVKCTHSLKLA